MSYFINFSLLFRNRNYRFIYLGQSISFIGTMVTGIAVPYQLYQLTHSVLMVGLLSLFQLLPLIVTGLIGGVFADRNHRIMLLLTTELVLAIGSLILVLNTITTAPQIWLIFIISITMSAATGFHRPALDGIIQQVVNKNDYTSVGALQNLTFSLSMIGGPALGGLIISYFSLASAYLFDFYTFIVSLCALLMVRNVSCPAGDKDIPILASLTQGLAYAIKRQELLGTYFIDFVAMLFGMPTALFPAIAASHGGVKILGLLYAAPAVGALLISVISGWTKYVTRHGLVVALSAISWGLSIVLFGICSNPFEGIFFLILAGAFDSISSIFRMTIWNETIPNDFRGRMAGIEMISYLSGPKLGDAESGLVAALFGVTTSIISGGILCIVGVVACSYFLPRFINYQSACCRTSETHQAAERL